MDNETLANELKALINRHSVENDSDTPDFILAAYLLQCLGAFEVAIQLREEWYGRPITHEPKEVK